MWDERRKILRLRLQMSLGNAGPTGRYDEERSAGLGSDPAAGELTVQRISFDSVDVHRSYEDVGV